MLNIRQLRAFAAVMLAGSVTGAATRLRISQPAISALIAGLERDLGFNLFVRDRNRLQATSEATSFYRSVASVLENLDGLERLATDIRHADEGTLRIAALPMLALEFLPRVAAGFLARHPNVRMILQAHSSPTVASLMAMQQFDLGFSESAYDEGWINAQRLRVRCVCVLPIGHPLAARTVLTPADLDDLPIVTAPADHLRTQHLAEVFQAAGAHLNVRVETPLFASMCAFVSQGAGYALVDAITAGGVHGGGLITRPFEPAFYNDFAVLYPASKPVSRIADAFMQEVTAELAGFAQ
ncbi:MULTISPECIES: LysR substrate-binding domain-containing protein [unclassified Achromobacter]|uniref:LysR substrate-binding domain-containing protein n=1 Tax=unclassified Achromobacter TaxID=2626865 RepID=UPI000B518016|nr:MULTISPECIES: LysR substrate-binding domain-containing protein [unclassified Achromobacter]OWT77049.1 LysR family transcriptional regulator [Achromobacter sp. HZ28]OWT77930.1 LysR family transcriptional regulator [Achromobacter sp. HZ34]